MFAPLGLLFLFLLEGAQSFLIMLAAALLHECGHLAAIRQAGASVMRVDIDVLSACIVYAKERIPPKSEVCIALAGPLFNLLGALAGSLLLLGVRSTPVLLFVAANLFFAFVNLIPVRGTDGGSALFYALLQSHPPETCARVCAVAAGVARAVFALLFVLSLYATGGNISVAVLFLLLCMPRGGY